MESFKSIKCRYWYIIEIYFRMLLFVLQYHRSSWGNFSQSQTYLSVHRVSCRNVYPYIFSNESARYSVMSAMRCDHFARDDESLSALTFLCFLGLKEPSGQARKSSTLWKRMTKPLWKPLWKLNLYAVYFL